jgi:hypothetical protein
LVVSGARTELLFIDPPPFIGVMYWEAMERFKDVKKMIVRARWR